MERFAPLATASPLLDNRRTLPSFLYLPFFVSSHPSARLKCGENAFDKTWIFYHPRHVPIPRSAYIHGLIRDGRGTCRRAAFGGA